MLELKQQVLSGATSESTDTQTSVLFLLSALQGLFTLLVNFLFNFQSKRFDEQKSSSERASRVLVQFFSFSHCTRTLKPAMWVFLISALIVVVNRRFPLSFFSLFFFWPWIYPIKTNLHLTDWKKWNNSDEVWNSESPFYQWHFRRCCGRGYVFLFSSSFVVVLKIIIMRIFSHRLFVPELSLWLKVSVCLGLKIKVYFLSNGFVDISVIYLWGLIKFECQSLRWVRFRTISCLDCYLHRSSCFGLK